MSTYLTISISIPIPPRPLLPSMYTNPTRAPLNIPIPPRILHYTHHHNFNTPPPNAMNMRLKYLISIQISIHHIKNTTACRSGRFDGVRLWAGADLLICVGEGVGDGGWRLGEKGEGRVGMRCVCIQLPIVSPARLPSALSIVSGLQLGSWMIWY